MKNGSPFAKGSGVSKFRTWGRSPGVRYHEHVSTYHSFYGTADVRKVSFNVLQKDGNMVDKIVSSNLVECDGGRREPMVKSDCECYRIDGQRDGGEKWHIRFAIDVTLHLTVE